MYLNQDVRFDRAGRYRFYVEDGHVALLQKSMGEQSVPTLISNVLEVEITRQDKAWEEQTAANAIALLDAPNDFQTRENAARTLRFLGTGRALDEMINRVGRASAPNDDAVVTRQRDQFVKGLFGARDRNEVVRRMELALMNSHADVGEYFMRTLASLRLVRTPGAPLSPIPPPKALSPDSVVK